MAIKRSTKPGSVAYQTARKKRAAKTAIRQLSWFAGKTDVQLESYIENNVNNLAEAKEALKLIVKLLRRVVLAIDEDAQ